MLTNIVSEDTLLKGILYHGVDIVEFTQVDSSICSKYNTRCKEELLDYPKLLSARSNEWFMPDEYKTLDIHSWLLLKCKTNEQTARVKHELELFEEHNMLDVLRFMKYLVDTLRSNQIVWGVGRGSSVASYVLFLIGVHKIDSIQYELPIDEFFKEV